MLASLPRPNQDVVEIIEVLSETSDPGSGPSRSAVAPQIYRDHLVTCSGKSGRKVVVSAGVFQKPVDKYHKASRVRVGPKTFAHELNIPRCGDPNLFGLHWGGPEVENSWGNDQWFPRPKAPCDSQ